MSIKSKLENTVKKKNIRGVIWQILETNRKKNCKIKKAPTIVGITVTNEPIKKQNF